MACGGVVSLTAVASSSEPAVDQASLSQEDETLAGDVARLIKSLVFGNHQMTVLCKPARVIRPRSSDETLSAVREALAERKSVKAASAGWLGSNASSCVDDGGIQIDTTGLDQILSVDAEKGLVRVQPGIRLWDFVQDLHQKHGLTIPVVQEFGEPTLGGLLGNATHGSSLQESSSSLQDWVESVVLVTSRGVAVVLQGEDLDFVGGNLGVLGIITELTLRAVPSFKVRADVWSEADSELEERILSYPLQHYAASVTWFPGQRRYTVAAYDKVDADTEGTAHNGQMEAIWWQRLAFPQLFRLSHVVPGLSCLLEKERYQMKAKSFFTDAFAKPVEEPVGWSHEMLYFACRDRCPMASLPFQLEEIAIPLSSVPDFIADARQLFATTKTCLPLNGVYFRFGRAARGALAMAGGRDTAYVGMEFVRNPYGEKYPKDFHVIQELEQVLLHKYQGRPHWGKNWGPMFAGVKDKYPRFAEFDAKRRSLDPVAMFENDFYRQLGADAEAYEQADACVAKEGCFCRTDRACPRGLRCQPGLLFEQARVCR
jgi:FAD/FMN-containing dehydrogenase